MDSLKKTDYSKNRDTRLAIRLTSELKDACVEKAKIGDLTLSQITCRLLKRWVKDDLDIGNEDML